MTATWLNQGMVMATQPEDVTDDDTTDQQDDLEVEQDDDTEQQAEQPADDDHDEIVWGAAPVAAEDEPEGMRNLRNRLREIERENKALKGQTKQDEVGERPTLEACEFDDDRFESELAEYIQRKNAAEERQRQQDSAKQKQAARWTDQQRDLDASFADLRVPGKEAARAAIEDEFPGEQFAYIVKAAGKNAAAFLVALGKSADKRAELKALAEEGSWAEFIALAAVGSKEVNVNRKPTTVPEQQHRGISGAGAGNTDAKLARLEAAANKSGDMTELFKYKRELRAAGKQI